MDWPLIGELGKSEFLGATASSSGTVVTDPGATNTKGAYTQIGGAVTTVRDASGFWVEVTPEAITSGQQVLIDIAIGNSGSQKIIVDNILVAIGQAPAAVPMYVPLPIPAGTKLWARYQTSSTSFDIRVAIRLGGEGAGPSAQFGKCYTYGAVTGGATGGTQVDSTGGANVEGGWVQIAATTDADTKAIAVDYGMRSNAATQLARYLIDIGVGAAAAEKAVVEDITAFTTVGGDTLVPGWSGIIPVSIPAGKRLAARVQTTEIDATDRKPDIIVHCFT